MVRYMVIAACLLMLLPGCGSGGGGAAPVTPTPPGTLRPVAVQGQAAVGTASAVYTLFPLHPVMDTHNSGWSAFVAPTTDATKAAVLNAMAPNGAVINVYSIGDAVPDLVDAVISSFNGVWVGNGHLFAHVDIIDNVGTRTFGLLGAALAPGGASGRVGLLFDQDSLAGAGVADTVDDIDEVTPHIESGGRIWIQVTEDTSGEKNLYSIDVDGTDLTARALVGAALPTGLNIVSIDAFAVELTGVFFALVATTTAADRRIYIRNTSSANFVEIMAEGDVVLAEVITDIHVSGTLCVFETGSVAWMAASGGVQWYLFGQTAGGDPIVPLARTAVTAQSSGGGVFGQLRGLNLRSPVRIPQFAADVVGSTNGVTFGTYGLSGGPPPVLATDNQSNTTGGVMGATYLGLGQPRAYREVSEDGSFLFGNVLQSGLSAICWLIPGDRIYALAVESLATPDGDTFAGFGGTSAHTLDNGCALFRVNLVNRGSGIYRQGP